jgi:type II secretory pathway pseudopilin PulG
VKRFTAQKRGANRACPGHREEGYALITLLLVLALAAIFAAGVIIPYKYETQRDQETEMIHRGVQYSRAIRAYYKKFGRYPNRLEDLDNTNNLRYLRKHYKDPLNKNQDFKLLHFGDPGVALAGGLSIGGGGIPGATPAGSPTGMNPGTGNSAFGTSAGFGGGSTFGGSGSGGSSFGGSGFGNSGVNSSGAFSQSSSFGGNSNSGFGTNSNSQTGSSQPGTNAVPGSDPTQDSSSQGQGTGPQGATGFGGQQPFGGGAIVGVASVNKNTTIREFNHKKKYNEWQFLYDPASDRGGIITTPYQPAIAGFGQQPALNGAQPAGSTGSAFGNSNGSSFGNSNGSSFGNSNSSSFGQSSSFGNSGNQNGSSPPVQPPSNPQQQ